MSWKDWSYWIKGGIILAAISLIISILYTILIQLGFVLPLFFFIYYPLKLASILFGWGDIITSGRAYFATLVFMPALYFIIGALIGWIYRKLKNRNK